MCYPDNCIRGVPNDSFLIDKEQVAPHLFYFDLKNARDDGWIEQSINWHDDANAITVTLDQRKANGDRQFESGIAILPRSEIERIAQKPFFREMLSYERRPIPAGNSDNLQENSYHGNILLLKTTSTSTMRLIAAGLALGSEYKSREDLEKKHSA